MNDLRFKLSTIGIGILLFGCIIAAIDQNNIAYIVGIIGIGFIVASCYDSLLK